MQITLSQAQQILASPIFGKLLPVKVSFKFTKLAKVINEEMKLVDIERAKLIESCNGVLSEDKAQFTFTGEDGARFQGSMNALMENTVDIGPNFPMPIETLGEVVDLTPLELLPLEVLFDMPEATGE